MTTLTISLPDSLKEFVEAEVRTKGFGNTSEYVRGLLREAQAKAADARLEALLVESFSRDENIAVSPEFWTNLRRDAAKVLTRRKASGKTLARR